MKHTAEGKCGFTLIEMLVVILILSITMSFALLAVGDFGKSQAIKASAEQLAKIIELAEQYAILEPAIFGIKFQDNGYEFYRYVYNEKQSRASWQALTSDHIFHEHSFPTNSAYHLILNQAGTSHRAENNKPQIVITSNGEITPFSLELMPYNKPALVRITALENGTITMQQLPS